MQIMELKWIHILGLIPVITLILPFVHCSDNMHFMPALECYDPYGRPQKCIPEFINAAYQIEIEASNTCGESGDQTFCVQTGYSNRKSCEVCRPGNHHPRYLTDLHDPHNPTWWQSETMYEGIQGTQVNLILHLGKSFDITYIRLVFNSPRPESFAIYKRMVQNGPWIPYQYYSATCRSTYGQPDFNFIKKGENESRALCTSEYSDISPLRLGNVAFSSLEGRPSATNFENSPALQDWVTATDIKITLDRLNTFGDEVFGDSQVLKSYFYSIADIAVGARCKCNGHASKCVLSTGLHGERQLVCQCKHNTDGPDCERCLPNYNDVEWRRATSKDVNECKPCNCNHYSEKCFFDRQLYNATGHGGHCIDCRDNRDGANCEKCKENYYMREDGYCIHCGCDSVGSRSLQCNSEGKCQCKPGVTGEKCDRCEVNYYHFSTHGCQSCGCDPRGSLDNVPSCDPETGICACKVNVEGKQCRECKPGFFNLALDNKFGCTPCFCYGHTSECKSADGYSIVSITSNFNKHKERWQAVNSFNQFQDLKYNQYSQTVGAITGPNDNVYFSAADRFLGDQRASYNRLMKFKLQLAGQIGPNPSSQDIILEGAGTKVSLPIFAQGNDMPDQQMREYVFRLHEHPEYSWQPTQSARGYLSILSNLTSIKIRASYSSQGEAILDDFELQTAHRGAAGQPAKWIEQCTCPDGYVGQFCESCSPGYRHSPAKGGPFMPCIPCDCNRHAQMCDPETGRCICNHNTAGDTCDQCARGYYGNALSGTPNDCKPCPCPNNGSCLEMADGSVMCLDCPVGYFGHRCEQCSDGYYGDPIGIVYGENLPCKACDCNGNVDPNAVGNCNRTTGECVKCIYNTAGSHCESCLEGYFGNPLALPHGKCQQCSCYPPGTEQTLNGISICEQLTGNCQCKVHVTGQNCDECQPGYFNLDSGNGCESCDCDPVGSHNITCDRYSGQCYCKPGVTGLRCDKCAAYQYGFSSLGCKPCDCDESGSKSLQCDQFGQCPCNDNVEGRQCNRCKENKYDRHQGCLNCPHCYDLVQDAANAHRAKLLNLSQTLESITQTPAVNDQDFEAKLKRVQSKVDILLDDAKAGAGGDGLTLVEHMNDLRDRLQKIETTLNDSAKLQLLADNEVEKAGNSTNLADETILNARNLLTNAMNLLKTDGNQALNNARDKFDQIGSQSDQISGISREARGLADQLESTSSYDLNSAKEANASAAGAYELALNTLNLQTQMENELTSELQLTMDQAKKELNETSRQTKQALKNSKDAYDTSLAIFTSVDSMKIPEIDTEKFRREATGAHDQALRLEERVNALVEDKSIFTDFAEHGELADVMKERALTQEKDAQASYKHVNESYTIARQAVASGDNILHNANKTYQTLSGFQSKVPDLSAQAQNALQNVSQIQNEISNAESMIATAENALHGADKDAADALENALKAQDKYAAQASKEAAFIRRKANDTKVNARNLRGEVDQLNGRVAVTSSKIDKLEGSLEKDEKTIEGAKKKVGEAKADSIGTKNIVEKAMNEVQVIIEDLNNLRDIDPNELHNLEKRLNDTETQLRESNLGGRLEALTEMKNRQNQLINDYENQIKGLQLEVDNIAAIADALPYDCYKRSRLEP